MRFLNMRSYISQVIFFSKDVRATIMIEMAFAIPILVLVGFAGMEIANATLAQSRISQIALSLADNASRITGGSSLSQSLVRERDINEIFSAAKYQSGELDIEAHGRIILSSLELNADDGQWIHWQRCFGNLAHASSYGNEGAGSSGTGFAGMGTADSEIKAIGGTAVMFVEIAYTYQPIVYGEWLGTKTFTTTAAYHIREDRDLSSGVVNPEPQSSVSGCETSEIE